MKRERPRAAGAPGKAPPCWEIRSEVATLRRTFGRGLDSVGFQTCLIVDSLNRPGVKRRPRWVWKPALQRSQRGAICLIDTATERRGYTLSLSFVDSCQR
jgi:hypothetical protein